MPNTYFQFKQFTIHQDRCAMKVCTDACLLGAWVAEKLTGHLANTKNILDIGAGTGLLSLMLAQKSSAFIDSVELEESAALQAAENMAASPWKNRCRVIQGDIKTIALERKYDCIISNPPFYQADLKSPDSAKNRAMHSEALGLDELIIAIQKNLQPMGYFALLLPYQREAECLNLCAQKGYVCAERIRVKQTAAHPFFRSMLLFSKEGAELSTGTLIIRENRGYGPEFTALLKDYYLYL